MVPSRLLSLAREILPRQAGVGLLAEVIPIEDGMIGHCGCQSTINHQPSKVYIYIYDMCYQWSINHQPSTINTQIVVNMIGVFDDSTIILHNTLYPPTIHSSNEHLPPTRRPKIPSRAKEKDPNLDPLFLRPARARALLRGRRIMVRTWTRFYMCRYTYRYPSICLPGYLSSIAAIDICIHI